MSLYNQNAERSACVKINTVNDLAALLKENESIDVSKIEFSSKLTDIVCRIEGNGYGAFIPGNQAQSLWELQESFLRLANYALHGSTNLRHLKREERKRFELQFVVREGSCLIDILLGKFWKELLLVLANKMSGRELVVLILGCATLASGYFCYDSYNNRVLEQSKQEAEIERLKEETKKFKILAKALKGKEVERYKEMKLFTAIAINDFAVNLAKRSEGATGISVGGIHLDKDEIADLKGDERSDARLIEINKDRFLIVGLEKTGLCWKLKLLNIQTEKLISAQLPNVLLSDEDSKLKDRVFEALQKSIPVSVLIEICGDNRIIRHIYLD